MAVGGGKDRLGGGADDLGIFIETRGEADRVREFQAPEFDLKRGVTDGGRGGKQARAQGFQRVAVRLFGIGLENERADEMIKTVHDLVLSD